MSYSIFPSVCGLSRSYPFGSAAMSKRANQDPQQACPGDIEYFRQFLLCRRALQKVKAFLHKIDEQLKVRAILRRGSTAYLAICTFYFTHAHNSSIRWDMNIPLSEEYFDNSLEDMVQSMYFQHMQG